MSEEQKEEETQENTSTEFIDTEAMLKHVEEIKDAFTETVTETTLTEKVSDLNTMLDNLSEEVDSWKSWHKTDYLEAMEAIKSHVGDIESEWQNVSESMKNQRDRLETLIDSFPGVIETATLKALSLRVTHLEKLVSQLFQESSTQTNARVAKRQLIISISALGVTIILWIVFIVINLIS